MRHDVFEAVALGCGELRVRADIEIEASAILQEHVRRPAPGDDTSEEVSGHLIGAESALPAQGAGDPVLVLQPKDASVHMSRLSRVWVSRERLFSGRAARPR
jgi:hypothetical protein